MKKLFSLLVCLTLILVIVSLAYAGSFDREDADEAGYVDTKCLSADAANTIARPCYIYGVQFYAAAATSYVNIYDAATASGTIRIEIAEATAGDSVYYKPAKPIKFDTGVSVDLTGAGAVVILEYR